MHCLKHLAVGLVALVSVDVAFAGAPASPDQLVVPPSQVVNGAVNGQPMTFQVRSVGPPNLILNQQTASRLGFKGGGWFGLFRRSAVIAKTKVTADTKATRFSVGAVSVKKRIGWTDGVVSPNASAFLGVGGVPQSVIRFQLRDPVAGERQIAFGMRNFGFPGYGTFLTIKGMHPIALFFDNAHDTTIASAAAGVELAKLLNGRFVGLPAREVVTLNIARPTRVMKLETPLNLAGLVSVSHVSVRTSDGGDARGIPDAEADPAEIVVTAPGKSPVKPSYFLIIGRNDMRNCSSMTVDKAKMQVRLMCRM